MKTLSRNEESQMKWSRKKRKTEEKVKEKESRKYDTGIYENNDERTRGKRQGCKYRE